MPIPQVIPVYSKLSQRHKQHVHMGAVGIIFVGIALLVSGMIGGSDAPSMAPPDLPKPRPVGSLPGGQLDAKDAWMGGAGKDLAKLQDAFKQEQEKRIALEGALHQAREQFRADMKALSERGVGGAAAAAPQTAPVTPMTFPPLPMPSPVPGSPPTSAPPVQPLVASPMSSAVNTPSVFPGQRSLRGPGAGAPSGTYPPGAPPNAGMNVGMNAGGAGQGPMLEAEPAAPALMRVSSRSDDGGSGKTRDGGSGSPGLAAAPSASGKPAAVPRTLGNFLPIGFTRAVLLGGLAAPTGGQAQGNPVPVLLRLADLGVLPNGFRSQVKDCLVVGEGYGDHSAERAYIRTTLLSCVMRDGRVLEVPIKGSIYGEDGMNGMMGRLVTKQGAILGNALLAGIASGIGSGIAQATQSVSTSALGSVNAAPTDANGILKQGLGTGVGRALDRLAQYYINLAERTFPVIEVQPGRVVDVVLQQGVSLDVALASIGPLDAPTPTRGSSLDNDRSALLRVVQTDSED